MPPTPPPSTAQQAREALGQRLREIRIDAGLSSVALAALCGWHKSKCTRLEKGRTPPSDSDIRAWARHCGAPGEAGDLIATARGIEGMYLELRQLAKAGLKHRQDADVPLYKRTRVFRVYEPGVIPGLFQTPDYARSLMGAIKEFHGFPGSLDDAVEARMERQRVVYEGGHRFAVLVEESALLARVAEPEVMAAQLGRLLEVLPLPNVSLGVIPAAASRTMWPVEGFWIFDDDRVIVELVSAEVTITQPREIRLYERTFSELLNLAQFGRHAVALIGAAVTALG